MNIRVDLQSISTTNSQSRQQGNARQDQIYNSIALHHDSVMNSLTTVHHQVDQRIDGVETLLKAQSAQLQANQYTQLGPFHRRRSSHAKERQRIEREKQEGVGEGIGIHVTSYTACDPGCVCACHLQTRATTPSFIDRVFGQVFFGYAGLPIIGRKCNTNTCKKSQAPCINLEYWFPLGFVWSQIIRLRLIFEPNVGPQFELSSLRRVPDSAQCVNYALNGNIDGLKDLFIRRLASPRDVSSTRGYSVLRVSHIYLEHAQAITDTNLRLVGNVWSTILNL